MFKAPRALHISVQRPGRIVLLTKGGDALASKKRLPEEKDVVQMLGALALGRANDCVRLAMEDDVAVETLDLSLLAEVKRSKGGVVEVKLVDRLKALEQLSLLLRAKQKEENPLLLSLLQPEEGA